MEPVLFFAAVILTGSVYYLVCCLVYFGFTGRPMLLAIKLCWKLAIATLVGAPLLGFGAVLLPALWLHAALDEQPNYKKWRDIIASFMITILCATALLFSSYGLAFSIFE